MVPRVRTLHSRSVETRSRAACEVKGVGERSFWIMNSEYQCVRWMMTSMRQTVEGTPSSQHVFQYRRCWGNESQDERMRAEISRSWRRAESSSLLREKSRTSSRNWREV